MKQKIDELIDHVYKTSKELVEKDEQILPMIFIMGADGKHIAVCAPDSMQSEENKDIFAAAVRAMCIKEKAVALVFVSESWTIPQEKVKEFMDNRHLYPSISSFPGRCSCVMITVEEKGCAGKMGVAIIDESTPVKKLGSIDFIVPDTKKGRFANFLGTGILN